LTVLGEAKHMDAVSTALSAAWLDAVHRVQSAPHRRLAEQAPQTQSSFPERTLTDVIERALTRAGSEPAKREDAAAQSDHHVDKLV
jgi:hypothetical protein